MKPANQVESRYSGQQHLHGYQVRYTSLFAVVSTLGIASCICLRHVSCMAFLVWISMQYRYAKGRRHLGNVVCVVEGNRVHNGRKDSMKMKCHCITLHYACM